jgi:hypothetical protein
VTRGGRVRAGRLCCAHPAHVTLTAPSDRARTDPDFFRGLIETVQCTALPQEVLAGR